MYFFTEPHVIVVTTTYKIKRTNIWGTGCRPNQTASWKGDSWLPGIRWDSVLYHQLQPIHFLCFLSSSSSLLSSSSSSSSSSSPLCRVLILIFLRQTVSLGNTVLQLFCCYYSWCLYRSFQCWIYCTFTLVLSEVCVQCPIWLFSVVPWLHGFLVCCSRIF